MIIIYILIALVVAAVIAFVAGSLRNRSLKKKLAQGEISEMPTVVQPPPRHRNVADSTKYAKKKVCWLP